MPTCIPGMTVSEFVEKIYFSCLEEKRASTRKGYVEIWENQLCDRIGNIQCAASGRLMPARR